MHVKLILNIFQYMYLLILVMLILGVPPTHPNTHTQWDTENVCKSICIT